MLALDVLKGFLLPCGGSSDLRLSAGGFGACFLSGTLGGYLRVFSVEVGLHHSPLRGFARSP